MEEDDNEGENYYEKKFLEESTQNNSVGYDRYE